MKNNKTLMLELITLIALCAMGGRASNESSEAASSSPSRAASDVLFYLTTADQSALFARQEKGVMKAVDMSLPVIEVNTDHTFQEMDGFGFSLTGGSALHLHNMTSSKRRKVLRNLFACDGDNIGISYLRVSIGASDLDPAVFSYNDLPAGKTDLKMKRFSLDPDRRYLIPVLKEILAINPAIKIMASPWSAPTWMKTNGASKGGELKPVYYDAYARYFVKYVRQMAREGITIDAVTVQNEPLHPGNNPSMVMEAEEQARFIKEHLGPAFQTAGLTTKIIIYDHNADRTDYPISILNDPDARKYVDGSAFHLYGGSIDNLTAVHKAHPDKNLYFTEQWIGAPADFAHELKWHTQNLIIGATRNWCKTVLEWNLAADSKLEPHTVGGCTRCLGALTIDGNTVARNPAYYIIAHASKFVRPGSVRVDSGSLPDLPNVAFQRPDGGVVIIVLNTAVTTHSFNINCDKLTVTTSLPGGAVGTFIYGGETHEL